MATPHLLGLPREIRDKIWRSTFENAHAVPSRSKTFSLDCHACSEEETDRPSAPLTWNQTFEPLLTCKQIYHEGYTTLMSSVVLEIRNGNLDFSSWLTWPLSPVNHKVRRLVVWAHVDGENNRRWISTVKLIGTAFPRSESVVVKAHVRPAEDHARLEEAIVVALPVVRLTRNKTRPPEIQIDLGYMYHRVMFRFLFGKAVEVTSRDLMEEHRLILDDLIEDDAFVEAALDEDHEDMQAMMGALWRVSRVSGQPTCGRLGERARRIAERRASEDG
ncbi:hypothetical protein H2204_004644 [Knufia peltigerae]|uniref:Uncharacterized protein n=1 Tax=Knufia peltigerae TaxID=1002370 RepID=A0AA39D0N1_9EURO|nr:hypothetical protein H2204_004644 [Knufia peltigerae]